MVPNGIDPVSTFHNKCFIYWEFGYQVAEDKSDTQMQGQTTAFLSLLYLIETHCPYEEGNRFPKWCLNL